MITEESLNNLFNHSNENFIINNNDRVAQMVLNPVIKNGARRDKRTSRNFRGDGGFGSTVNEKD